MNVTFCSAVVIFIRWPDGIMLPVIKDKSGGHVVRQEADLDSE